MKDGGAYVCDAWLILLPVILLPGFAICAGAAASPPLSEKGAWVESAPGNATTNKAGAGGAAAVSSNGNRAAVPGPNIPKSQTWFSVFPIGAGVFDLAPDRQDSTVLYAATNLGLFKSSDSGMSWLPLFSSISVNNLQFAQSASEPNVMYMAISQDQTGQLYKSTDRGKSWNQIGPSDLNRPVSILALDPRNSDRVFVKDGYTLHKTLNGGRSWGDVTPRQGGGRIIFISFDPFKDDHVFVGAGSGGGATSDLLESADGGLTWTVKNYPEPPGKSKVAFANPTIATWKFFSIYPGSPNELLGVSNAVGNQVDHVPGLVISEDSGQSWRDITVRENLKDQRSVIPISYIEWSKTSSSNIYVGTQQGLFTTTSAGRDWKKVLPYPTGVIRESSPGELFASTSLGVFKSSDGGHKWHQASLGLPISFGVTDTSSENRSMEVFDAFYQGVATSLFELEASDANHVHIGGRGGFWTSEDGGVTWAWHSVASDLNPGMNTSGLLPQYFGPNVRQIFTTADKTVFVHLAAQGAFGTGSSRVVKIEPDGKLVTIHTSRSPNQIAVSSSDSQVLYMSAFDQGGLWADRNTAPLLMKSEDGGFSWQTFDFSRWLRPSLSRATVWAVPAFAVSAQSSKICYAFLLLNGGSKMALMMTTDGGNTWKDVLPDSVIQGAFRNRFVYGSPLLNPVIAIDPNNGKSILIPLDGYLYQFDGSEWKQLALSQRRIYGVAVSSKSPNTVFVASDLGVSASKDGGTSWLELAKGLHHGEQAHRIVTAGDQVFVQGDHGIYRLTGSEPDWMKARWTELEDHPESDPLGYVSDVGQKHDSQPAATDSDMSTAHPSMPGTASDIKSDGKLAAPLLLSPEDGASFDNFPRETVVKWQAVPGAVSYTVEVDFSDPPGWDQTVLQTGVKKAEFSFRFVGKQRGRWRVCGVDSKGQQGEMSPWREFVYTI